MTTTTTAGRVAPADLHASLRSILDELLGKAPERNSWILDGGVAGFAEAMRPLSAADASRVLIPGRATIAGHANHVRFFLALFNAWARGEDPWKGADWAGSWRTQAVAADEWARLVDDLAREAEAWRAAVASPPAPRVHDESTLGYYLASVGHVAYHLGAVRQLLGALAAAR